MNTHRRQHYLPQSYLQAWTDPECPANHEPYVWIFDREGKEGRAKSPKNIFHETDMYTIVGEDGERDLKLEQGPFSSLRFW